MDFSTWLLFTIIALMTTFAPGPAILLAITNSLSFGFRATVYSTLGNELGLLLIALVAVLGLGAVLATSTAFFLVLKTLGAFYLIYLGIRQWRTKGALFAPKQAKSKHLIQNNWSSFLQGFLVAITNPKAILFFSALFPQFIRIDQPLMLQFSILLLTFSALSSCALLGYGFLAVQSKQWFHTEKRAKFFNRLFGATFIALGIGLLQVDNQT